MERKQTICPKVDSPHPLNSQEARALTCRERGLHAETAQSALTVILKLGIGGLTSVMLVVSGVVPGSVCSSFFEASSQNCGSLDHGYSLITMQLTSPPGGGFSIYKTAHGRWLRMLSVAREEERALTTLDDQTIFMWSPLPVFLCFCLFSLLIKLTLWPKFFHRQKECRGHERQGP